MTPPALLRPRLQRARLGRARSRPKAGRSPARRAPATAPQRSRPRGFDGLVFDGTAPSDRAVAGAATRHARAGVRAAGRRRRSRAPPSRRRSRGRAARSRWIGYLSTVGVYGDQRRRLGRRDDARANPGTRAQPRRLDAEQAWLALGRGQRPAREIFRLAGIYGPGRSAIDSLARWHRAPHRQAGPGVQPHPRRRHRDALSRRIAQPDRTASTMSPTTSRRRRRTSSPMPPAARHRAAPPMVPFETADLSPMAAASMRECKRVSNRRMKVGARRDAVVSHLSRRNETGRCVTAGMSAIHLAFIGSPRCRLKLRRTVYP